MPIKGEEVRELGQIPAFAGMTKRGGGNEIKGEEDREEGE